MNGLEFSVGLTLGVFGGVLAGGLVVWLWLDRQRADVREQLDYIKKWEDAGLQPTRQWQVEPVLRAAAYTPPEPVSAVDTRPFDVDAAVRSMGLWTRLEWHLSQPRYDWLLGWVTRLRRGAEPVVEYAPRHLLSGEDTVAIQPEALPRRHDDTFWQIVGDKGLLADHYASAAAHVRKAGVR